MKTLNLIKVSLFIIAIMMASCQKDDISLRGEGSIVTETLAISDFSGIDLDIAGNVIVSQGPVQEVKAVGHLNIINRLTDRVSGDIWHIDLERGRYKDYELTIHVVVPHLEYVALSGSGHIAVNDFSDQTDLDVNLDGSGQIDLNSFSGIDKMDIDISGSGKISASKAFPSLRKIDINISGSGSYEGFPVMSDACEINMTGSGTCKVSVRNSLDVTIKGSGLVYYKGHPNVIDNTNSAGGIINAN